MREKHTATRHTCTEHVSPCGELIRLNLVGEKMVSQICFIFQGWGRGVVLSYVSYYLYAVNHNVMLV